MSDRLAVGLLSLTYACGGGILLSETAMADPIAAVGIAFSFTAGGYTACTFLTGAGTR